jgi:hypothetical protein
MRIGLSYIRIRIRNNDTGDKYSPVTTPIAGNNDTSDERVATMSAFAYNSKGTSSKKS